MKPIGKNDRGKWLYIHEDDIRALKRVAPNLLARHEGHCRRERITPPDDIEGVTPIPMFRVAMGALADLGRLTKPISDQVEAWRTDEQPE